MAYQIIKTNVLFIQFQVLAAEKGDKLKCIATEKRKAEDGEQVKDLKKVRWTDETIVKENRSHYGQKWNISLGLYQFPLPPIIERTDSH